MIAQVYAIKHRGVIIYVGQTTWPLSRRLSGHFWDAQKAKPRGGAKIVNKLRKYPKTEFTIELIEQCDALQVDDREAHWIAYHGTVKNGCNSAFGGRCGNRGIKYGEEFRRKVSALKKGKPNPKSRAPSPEHLAKLMAGFRAAMVRGNPRKGQRLSEATRQKLSESHIGQVAWNKGKPFSAESRAKMSAAKRGRPPPNKGKKMSEETRAKLSGALKGRLPVCSMVGRKHSPETIARMRETRKGRVMSEETKERVRAAVLGQWVTAKAAGKRKLSDPPIGG